MSEPSFVLKFDSQPMPNEVANKFVSFAYNDHERTDSLTLVFDNNDLSLFEYEPMQVGTIVQFRHGYINPDEFSRFIYLKIIAIAGFKELTIECMEVVSIFGFVEQKTKYWLDTDLDTIISEIAKENDIKKYEVVERKDENGNILKFNYFQPKIEDFAFLYSLGLKIGYQVYYEDGTLFFNPRKYFQTPYMKFGYESLASRDYRKGDIGEGQIVEFTPQQNAMNKRGEFAAGGVDYETKRSFHIEEKGTTKKVTYLTEKLWDYEAQQGRFKKLKEARLVRVPLRSGKEAKDVLGGKWVEEMSDSITATMLCVGEPNLRARKVIQVDNVSIYTGKYYVTSVTHTFGGGPYESTAELTRNSAFDEDSKYSINNLNGLINKQKQNVAEFKLAMRELDDPKESMNSSVLKQK